MINLLTKVLIAFGSVVSIGIGIWHFSVPKIWNWYSYIHVQATELIVAVRAINIFFSLSLVLFGLINLLLAYGGKSNRYSMIVVLISTCVLWLFRVVLQIIYPQGSMNRMLQYGMLFSFIIVFLCYTISLISIIVNKNFG